MSACQGLYAKCGAGHHQSSKNVWKTQAHIWLMGLECRAWLFKLSHNWVQQWKKHRKRRGRISSISTQIYHWKQRKPWHQMQVIVLWQKSKEYIQDMYGTYKYRSLAKKGPWAVHKVAGWADICNIVAFYNEIAPMFTLSQPTTGQSCTPTNPPSTAGSHEVLDCWWWRIIWVHRTIRMVAMNCRSVCNRVQQTAKAHLCNSSGSGSKRNTVGHAPR